MMPGRHLPSPRMVVRPLGRLQLLVDIELPAGFEHQYLHPMCCHHVRRHSAGRTRTNDDGVIGSPKVHVGLRVALDQPDQIHCCTLVKPAFVATRMMTQACTRFRLASTSRVTLSRTQARPTIETTHTKA